MNKSYKCFFCSHDTGPLVKDDEKCHDCVCGSNFELNATMKRDALALIMRQKATIEKYPCYAKCPPLCHELRALVPLLRVMLDSVKFEKEIANETD